MTASVVAISGVIGWVGLVIPHIARMAVGPSFDRLLPTAMLLGASYLLLVDTLARTMARIEVPIGILTAIIGAPFFLWLLAQGPRGLVMTRASQRPMLAAHAPGLRLRRQGRRPRRRPRGAAGRGAVPAGPQRLGQDHAVQDHAGPAAAPRPARCASTARRWRS